MKLKTDRQLKDVVDCEWKRVSQSYVWYMFLIYIFSDNIICRAW